MQNTLNISDRNNTVYNIVILNPKAGRKWIEKRETIEQLLHYYWGLMHHNALSIKGLQIRQLFLMVLNILRYF